jgi:hypothetical protein
VQRISAPRRYMKKKPDDGGTAQFRTRTTANNSLLPPLPALAICRCVCKPARRRHSLEAARLNHRETRVSTSPSGDKPLRNTLGSQSSLSLSLQPPRVARPIDTAPSSHRLPVASAEQGEKQQQQQQQQQQHDFRSRGAGGAVWKVVCF